MVRKGERGSFAHSEFRSWPLNKLALQRWAALTMMYGRNTIHCCYELVGSGADNARTHAQIHTNRHSQSSALSHTYTQTRGSGRANSIFLSSRQIQFPSRTYVSWLKQPTKTGEICHILQDWTQYWVLLWQWEAFSPPPPLSLSKSLLFSLMTFLRHLMPSSVPFFLFSITFFSFLHFVAISPTHLPLKTCYSENTLCKAHCEFSLHKNAS